MSHSTLNLPSLEFHIKLSYHLLTGSQNSDPNMLNYHEVSLFANVI